MTLFLWIRLAGTLGRGYSYYEYDAINRLTVIYQDDASLAEVAYSWTYNAAGRVVAAYSDWSGTSYYRYDANGQLLSADNAPPLTDENYSYDAAGNRTMSGYSTGADNRLASDGTYTYSYNNEGHRTRGCEEGRGGSAQMVHQGGRGRRS